MNVVPNILMLIGKIHLNYSERRKLAQNVMVAVMLNNPNAKDNLVPFKKGYDSRRNNNGKKPTKIKKFLKEHNISSEDAKQIFGNFLFKYSKDDLKKFLEEGGKKLPFIAYGLLKAAFNDLVEGRVSAIGLMLEYTIGKPKQFIEETINQGNEFTSLNPNEVKEKLTEMIYDLAGDEYFRGVMEKAIKENK